MNAEEIIQAARATHTPNAGIKAVAKRAREDEAFCIMDDSSCGPFPGYRCECPDKQKCGNTSFMHACIATRRLTGDQFGEPAVEIYNNAMKS